jgi:hypothetical protein
MKLVCNMSEICPKFAQEFFFAEFFLPSVLNLPGTEKSELYREEKNPPKRVKSLKN